MYGIFSYIWHIFVVNVGKYSIHGAYGIFFWGGIVEANGPGTQNTSFLHPPGHVPISSALAFTSWHLSKNCPNTHDGSMGFQGSAYENLRFGRPAGRDRNSPIYRTHPTYLYRAFLHLLGTTDIPVYTSIVDLSIGKSIALIEQL